jgi:TonB family protein
MLENLFSSPFLNSLALTLLHFLWQGVLVATVLKSLLLIFNNNRPQLRYALSSLAMLVNLLLPIITFIIVYRAELSSINPIANSLVLSEFIQELKQPDALFSFKELTELLPTLLPYISILWLSTITLLAGKLLIEISTVNRLPKQGVVAPTDKLQTRFDELVKQIHLKITPRLLISLQVEVPMAIGWLKPVVLLPASMISGLNNAQLEMLILHELAHIRRHDYLVNFLQTLVEILLFFHPAVLWVSKQMRNEREYCSDDIAVQHCGDAIAYAHTLADTASLCTKAHNHTIPDMAMAASGGDLKQRVIRLVGHHCAPKNNISKWFASATIIFSVLLLSSKQLLTMPLLDIWHNENPWKQPNHTENNTQKSQAGGNTVKSNLPNSTIAQQLLKPQELTPQSSEQEKNSLFAKKVFTETAQPIKSVALLPTAKKASALQTGNNNQTALETNQISTNEASHFNAQLDNLSANTAPQLKNVIESSITSNSLMVEDAFKRSNSTNPYQQELALLAEPQKTKAVTTQDSIANTNNTQHATLLEKPSTTNRHNQFDSYESNKNGVTSVSVDNAKTVKVTNNKLTNIKSVENKDSTAEEPIWQNAEQLKSVDPVYPSVAKRKGIEIEVEVNFTIDVDGQIKNITFARQNKINYFKSSIRSAIKKWRFLPAKVDDQPVESQMSKVFAFSLQS